MTRPSPSRRHVPTMGVPPGPSMTSVLSARNTYRVPGATASDRVTRQTRLTNPAESEAAGTAGACAVASGALVVTVTSWSAGRGAQPASRRTMANDADERTMGFLHANTSQGTVAHTAIQPTAVRARSSGGTSTILIDPWTTKWTIAAPQIVLPPASNRKASGNAMMSASRVETSATAKGWVKKIGMWTRAKGSVDRSAAGQNGRV